MPDPRRRRVTLTLTLTDDEFDRIGGDAGTDADIVIDRIGSLAVVAVIPSTAAKPRCVNLGALLKTWGLPSGPPLEARAMPRAFPCGATHASAVPGTSDGRPERVPARIAVITRETRI